MAGIRSESGLMMALGNEDAVREERGARKVIKRREPRRAIERSRIGARKDVL